MAEIAPSKSDVRPFIRLAKKRDWTDWKTERNLRRKGPVEGVCTGGGVRRIRTALRAKANFTSGCRKTRKAQMPIGRPIKKANDQGIMAQMLAVMAKP